MTRTFNHTPGMPSDAEGPVFREPWEATAFAIAVSLSEAGLFEWREWVDTLAAEIKHAESEPDHDNGSRYYEHWFSALEKILVSRKIVDHDAVETRHQYLRDNPVPHDHVARREPVCIA